MSIAEKLQTIAQNEQRVYNAGYEKGKSEGGDTETAYNQGLEDGKQSEYDRFWDNYQSAGKNPNCDFMFAGQGWVNSLFKPKYDIKPIRAQYMFNLTAIKGDLFALCEQQGIIIDFSNCQLFNNFAANANGITRFGVIDMRKATDNITFINCTSLVTIDKLIVAATTKYTSYAFEGVTKLENLTVDGTIAQNNFNVKYCTLLSKASIESIINCLSADTSGLTVTLSLTAVKKAFETSSGANDGNTSEEWLNLIAPKSNWTITLS